MRPTLRHGALRLTLAPECGGAVAGFWLEREAGDLALLRPMPAGASDALLAGMFPMLPFANCLRDNRFSFGGHTWRVAPNIDGHELNFHGSGWRLPWSVGSVGPDTAVLGLDAEDGIWRYRAEQRFTLGEDGLAVTLSVTNRAASPMPFSFGLHPWFPRHGNALAGFAAGGLWSTAPTGEAQGLGPVPADADHAVAAPVPRDNLNVCYAGWSGQARVIWPDLGLAVSLAADPVWDHLMVHVPAADPDTFCLEPQTNPPCGFDGLDRGSGFPAVHVLQPGECLSGEMTLGLSSLSTEPFGNED